MSSVQIGKHSLVFIMQYFLSEPVLTCPLPSLDQEVTHEFCGLCSFSGKETKSYDDLFLVASDRETQEEKVVGVRCGQEANREQCCNHEEACNEANVKE